MAARSARVPLTRSETGWGKNFPIEVDRKVEEIAKNGGTPLVVADGSEVLGTVYLKGHREGWAARALPRVPSHGHSYGDGDR